MPRFSVFIFTWVAFTWVAGFSAAPRAQADTSLDLFDLGAPAFTSFSARDGVPSSVVVAVRTDRDGFVWIGSPEGVARYDGHQWTPSDDPDMAHPVDSLEVDAEGTLWAAFRNSGLAHYDGTRWHVEDARTGLPSTQIRRFKEIDDGHGAALWATTWDQGLMKREPDGRWTLDPGNGSLPPGPVLTMAQTRKLGGHARLWVGTGNAGLWFREGLGPWQRFRADDFEPGQVEYLHATEHDGKEELWISVFSQGVWRLTEDGLHAWTRERGDLPTDDVYDLAETPLSNDDYALWVATRSGLVRIHHEHAEVFGRRHGMPSDAVRGLGTWRSPSGEDVLWLATESGVARTIVDASAWQTASLMGARGTGVFAVLVDSDRDGSERLWVGASQDGIGLFDGGRWRHFDASSGALPNPDVRLIAPMADADGERALWVGTMSGQLLRVRDGPTFERIHTPWPKQGSEAVLTLLARQFEGEYEQWFGLREGGIYRKRAGRWTAFQSPNVGNQWRVVKLIEQRDTSGRSWLWATSNQGLARFDGEQWTFLNRSDGLPDANLLGLTLIPDRRQHEILWAGSSSSGIVRVDVTDPEHPVVLQNDFAPAPDPTAYSAVADSSGRVYVCTNNGIQVLTPIDGSYASRVFTRKNGLIHDECNTNAQAVDAHDRYWAGMLGGLTVHDPQAEHTDTLPKPLRVVDIRVDGSAVDGSRLKVGPAARDIEIEFALLSWQRESESRFRTELIGYDTSPGSWTAQGFRSFSSLPAGHYVLRIEGRDYAGNLSTPIDVAIDVEAHWWQKLWARILFAGGLVLIGYAFTMMRLHTLKEQRRALERAVASRTAELNEANARLVELSYIDALTGLANRRRLLEVLESEPIDGAPTNMTLIFVDVDYFKEYNDQYGHPAGDEALRAVAATLQRCVPRDVLVARYGGEEFACLWPEADLARGIELAETIRTCVEAEAITVPGTSLPMHLTISAGVASSVRQEPADAHRLLRDADVALYQAKRDGRNRVRFVA